MNGTWHQSYSLFGQGTGVSALLAGLPIFTLLILLGVMRKPAWMAAISAWVVAIGMAMFGYQMPVKLTASSALYGAAFGLFPISWIVFWAIALYRTTLDAGKFHIIQGSIENLTSDLRLQALLIAFAFGAFLEGAAGFGTPVAIAAAMLVALGFSPLRAATLCLIANTAPVAFGSIGIPVVTLAGITGLPIDKLSGAVGRLCAPLSLIVPAYLIVLIAGWGGALEIWPAILVAGGVFSLVQVLVSNFIGPQLTDILSALLALGSILLLLRFWRPPLSQRSQSIAGEKRGDKFSPDSMRGGQAAIVRGDVFTKAEIFGAWMPYGLLVVFVLLWGVKPVQAFLNIATRNIAWPLLHNAILRMPPVVAVPAPYGAMYQVNSLSAAGTACMFATFFAALLLRYRFSTFIRLLVSVCRQLLLPTVTVASILSMAFVMNYSGATATLGLAFAASGAMFPFFSPLLGWLGVFLTGSDTSSNALFGNLQVVTATRLGFSPVLMAAANSAGGVMGKMISLQTIVVAAAATGMSTSDQAKLFRFTLRHSVLLATAIGIEVLLYAYVIGARLTP
jgi:L-lactate transport